MMIFTAVLMYIILAAAILSGVLAVFIAASTLFSSKTVVSQREVQLGEEVQIFARIDERKEKKKKRKVKKEKDSKTNLSDSLLERLADLPEGYHVLTGLELKLTEPVSIKDSETDRAEVDYLVMGPKRIFLFKPISIDKEGTNIRLEEKVVFEYLKRNLTREYRVVGWLVGEGDNDGNTKIVSEQELIGEVTKLERYSQGKKSRPVGEDVHEILSVLKLSRWESGESDKQDQGTHVFA